MHWTRVDKRWQDRLGKTREGDVSWTTEQWTVPGEEALEVRVCKRDGVPLSKYAGTHEAPRTSIVLHQTAGYGQFAGLMGGSDHHASAHFLVGRCGTPYLLVPTEFTAWHATWWNANSIGIEIDCIANLYKDGDQLHSEYGKTDVYCSFSDEGVYLEKSFEGVKYWATMTEAQYRGTARLLKALCFKHHIPRLVLPEPQRFKPFEKSETVRGAYRGICTHYQIDPARRVDIGPYIDWAKLIEYAGLFEADCFHPPASLLDSWKNEHATGPAVAAVDKNTLRVQVGKHGGRICFSVRQPGDALPVTPAAGEGPAAKAAGKRDAFIAACMNFLGAPYKAGSNQPAQGLDGVNLVALAMRRVGLFASDDAMPTDAEHLCALWHLTSGTKDQVPDGILPGDLCWFGKGDHDRDPQQHPMVYLGGGRVLGPVPDGGADSAVQVIPIAHVPEKFAGWMHVDDLGRETKHTEHPGPPPAAGAKLTGALLPASPATRYDALKKLVLRAKGQWDEGKGKVNLVGVKNLHDRCQISPEPGGWNDTLFAAFLDQGGHKCCLELRASLNPGTDQDPAGTWQLWEGSWKFKLASGALQPDGKVKGWHDAGGMGAPRPVDHTAEAKADEVQPAAPKGDTPPAPKEKPPIEVPKRDRKPPSAATPFVFDSAGKKLSMKFGLRMMRNLIEWELKEGGEGCIYSWNGAVARYPQLAPKRGTEWPVVDPLMQLQPVDQVSFEGQQRGLWKAFGVEWVASGATNCCNSQMAAIFAALPDGKLRIQRDDGPLELDVVKGTPAAPGIKGRPVDNPKLAIGYSSVFANAWIQAEGSKLRLDNGKKVFGGYAYIAPAWAMKWLGVGDAVGKWGEVAALPRVRIGDNACWYSHNWLVGDVRYQVSLQGRKTPVYVDQSDFARFERPQPLAEDKGGYLLTREDCLWIEQHEDDFEARLKAFLEGQTLEFEGRDYQVEKIAAVAARVFSANCVAWQTWGTARGVVYQKAEGTDGTKPSDWTVDEQKTRANKLRLGISRPWGKFKDQYRNGSPCFGFARWYDHAGGK